MQMFLACLFFLNNFQCLLSGQKKWLTPPAVIGVTCRTEAGARGQGSNGCRLFWKASVVASQRTSRASPSPGWILGWRSQRWRASENQVQCGILHRLNEARCGGGCPLHSRARECFSLEGRLGVRAGGDPVRAGCGSKDWLPMNERMNENNALMNELSGCPLSTHFFPRVGLRK